MNEEAKSAVERQALHKTWLPADTEDTSNPSYYKSLPKDVEVYEIIEAVVNRELGFTENISYSDLGHVLRYTLRLGAKNGSLQELKKVQWYLSRIIEREDQESEQKQEGHGTLSQTAPGSIGAMHTPFPGAYKK